MVWSSDFTLSEIGYISEDEDPENDRTVNVFSCCQCESTAEYENTEENNELKLLALFSTNDELEDMDEEELEAKGYGYTEYAKEKYM